MFCVSRFSGWDVNHKQMLPAALCGRDRADWAASKQAEELTPSDSGARSEKVEERSPFDWTGVVGNVGGGDQR